MRAEKDSDVFKSLSPSLKSLHSHLKSSPCTESMYLEFQAATLFGKSSVSGIGY